MATYLITGGAGFIGSHLVELITKNGNEVKVLDNLSSGSHNLKLLDSLNIELIKGDIQNPTDVSRSMYDVDIVIHLAAMNRAPRSIENPVMSNKINIDGTVNLLEEAKKRDVKFIYGSSSSVFGNLSIQPRPEESNTFSPTHPYGLGKLTSEYYCNLYNQLFDLETSIVRYFAVYGPRQSPFISYSAVIPKFISQILNNQEIEVYGGDQTRNFTYVKDTAKATFEIAKNKTKKRVYNIGGLETISIDNLTQLLFEISKLHVKIIHSDYRQGDVMESIPQLTNLKSEFNFKHDYNFKMGLEITFQWIKNNPNYFN